MPLAYSRTTRSGTISCYLYAARSPFQAMWIIILMPEPRPADSHIACSEVPQISNSHTRVVIGVMLDDPVLSAYSPELTLAIDITAARLSSCSCLQSSACQSTNLGAQ